MKRILWLLTVLLIACGSAIARDAWTTEEIGNAAIEYPAPSNAPPPPSIATITPGSGTQGWTLPNVVVTGQYTHFVQGTTTANFGPNITVNSVSVSSAASLTASITISATAAPGPQPVTITTGAETASLTSGFNITAPVAGMPTLLWLGGGHTGGVNSVAAGPDGTVWSAGGDGTIKQWAASSMALLQTSSLTQSGAALAANGQQALINTAGQTETVNLGDDSVIRTFSPGGRGPNYLPAISANGQTYAFGQANWGPDLLVFANGQGAAYTVVASAAENICVAGLGCQVEWYGGVNVLAV